MGLHLWYCNNCKKETDHEVREQAHHDPAVRALTLPPLDGDYQDHAECTCTVCGFVEWVDPVDIFQLDVHDFGD
ncbi:hypothetical protein AL542_02005 [Grimontia hollisae]|uniref:Uncharacterized protein n=2 Tax=Grimontia hollisae TaxID=673 RepID=D0I5I3_GRIHO|nr:hypothetical protein [Grimontia hollisae]AMG29240.1 hypothetical protein AL542_02005 [Grimontia hollisae]EEY73147.1 hypothetical protein VHA_001000 [Grimontia hollisae CIP 101886]MDF2185128.1 hypothetical protein [Grimontia hollisae]STO76610.1 Uncharacterised protein [Grimontia hollisae]STO98719.1 Uncharacterised protein [Grimontia hollisae]